MEPQLFKITQNAIFRNSAGEILILRHMTGKWLLPGGKINKGESWIDGLKRELREEVGVSDFQIQAIVDVDSWTENDEGHLVITYLIGSFRDSKITLSKEHGEYVWVREENLKKYDFWHPNIVERIKKAFR